MRSRKASTAPRQGAEEGKDPFIDALRTAGIRLNPELPDPWDIMVQDIAQFVRRLTSPFKNGMTELADMYVEGIWDCEDVSEFLYQVLDGRPQ